VSTNGLILYQVIKSRRTRWIEHCNFHGEASVYKILVEMHIRCDYLEDTCKQKNDEWILGK